MSETRYSFGQFAAVSASLRALSLMKARPASFFSRTAFLRARLRRRRRDVKTKQMILCELPVRSNFRDSPSPAAARRLSCQAPAHGRFRPTVEQDSAPDSWPTRAPKKKNVDKCTSATELRVRGRAPWNLRFGGTLQM